MSDDDAVAEALDELRTHLKTEILQFSYYDDIYEKRIKSPVAAYQAALDRVVLLIDGRITSWLDPLPEED